MIQSGDHYEIRSQNSNLIYWEQGEFPEWTALSCLRAFPTAPAGHGVEPHYHDNDEIWLFRSGHGEVWVGDQRYDVTPNTAVYTPLGVVHRFQMFEPYENTAIVTSLEGKKRPLHLVAAHHGHPVPTAAGFVIPGSANVGPIADPGSRCPLSELREITFSAGELLAEKATFDRHEHWIVTQGAIELTLGGVITSLHEEDVVLMRTGGVREIGAQSAGRVVLVRERKSKSNT